MAIAGLGTDIIEIARLGKDDTVTNRLARRILTEYEYGRYQKSNTKLAYLAKRFAAKEATVKAFGTGIGNGVSWQHIEVRNNEAGAPFLTLSGELAVLCEKRGIKQTFLSISDEQSYAVATVILES